MHTRGIQPLFFSLRLLASSLNFAQAFLPGRPFPHKGVRSMMQSSLTKAKACQARMDSGPLLGGKHQGRLLELAGFCVPPLTYDVSKGGAGRVAVIGGSEEYTGAPYFAAASALRAGVDLAHVFCEKSAGTAIKSYSPELIVHPLLHVDAASRPTLDTVTSVGEWITRIDGLLVGPGLGRDIAVVTCCAMLITQAATQKLPLVLDADGLFILTSAFRGGKEQKMYQDMLAALRDAPLTITPNKVEFERLCKALDLVKEGESAFNQAETLAPKVAVALGKHTIVIVKGPRDIISDGVNTVWCDEKGSLRRCGGQGDVLAGLLLAFKTWAHAAVSQEAAGAEEALAHELYATMQIAGSMAACVVARRCSNSAFAKRRRAMVAGDLIEELGAQFDTLFPIEGIEEFFEPQSGSGIDVSQLKGAAAELLENLGKAPPADWQEDWNAETRLN